MLQGSCPLRAAPFFTLLGSEYKKRGSRQSSMIIGAAAPGQPP